MTDAQILALIKSEISKSNQSGKFNLNTTPQHTHTGQGQDAPQINQSDIIPGPSVRGSIKFASNTVYTLNVNFNPTAIHIYGNAVHKTAGTIDIRAFIIGDAYFAPSSYFQPKTTTSVITGGPAYTGNPPPQKAANGTYNNTIIQSSAYFSLSGNASPTTPHTNADEFHLVLVDYSGVLAAADVISFSRNAIKISVVLASGWEINANFVVT